jgi:hypothetical protein
MSTWRDHYRPIIAEVLHSTKGQDEKAIKRAIRDAYPSYERANWPYKVWLSEVKRQRFGKAKVRVGANQENLF